MSEEKKIEEASPPQKISKGALSRRNSLEDAQEIEYSIKRKVKFENDEDEENDYIGLD